MALIFPWVNQTPKVITKRGFRPGGHMGGTDGVRGGDTDMGPDLQHWRWSCGVCA
jgi:hypothetical protein